MKLANHLKRMLSALLIAVLVLGMLPVSAFAAGETTYVVACSDFQNKSGDSAGANTVTGILNTIRNNGYTTMDGFLFAGDLSQSMSTSASTSGKTALQNAVQSVYGTGMDEIYVQGNHDPDDTVGSVCTSSGAHDTDAYGVYVINEKDYPWGYNSASNLQSVTKATANALDAYLDAKVAEGYTQPIFVVTHLPLHYTSRTASQSDGKYAKYLYDVLDEGGEAGLNIVFLFGHNHSSTYDDYVGGSAIYLPVGHSITIDNEGSTSSYFTDTLSFTYMNAGYVGYSGSAADSAMTMTVFEITDSELVIKRFDSNGEHVLKAKGTGTGYPSVDTSVVQSGAIVALGEPVEKVTLTDGNVSVTAAGLTGLSAAKAENPSYDTEAYSAYASYTITPEGYTEGKSATVTITLDAADGFDAARKVYLMDGDKQTDATIVDGKITFTTTHFGTFVIAQKVIGAGYTYELATSVEAGGKYVIVGSSHAAALADNDGTIAAITEGLTIDGDTLVSEEELPVWTVSGTSGATITSEGGRKLGYSSSSWNLTGNADNTFDIVGSGDSVTIRVIRASSGYNRYYFYFDGSSWTSKTTNTQYVRLFRLVGSGSVTPDEPETPNVPETPDAPESGWVALPAGNTYVLDTDGIDSGEKYLIVAQSYAKALSAAAGSNNAVDVTIDGNNATADAAYGWTFTASGSNYTIQNNGTYLGRSSSKLAAGSASTTWTVGNSGSGQYTITQSSGSSNWWGGSSNYYVRWSNSNGYFQASSYSTDPVRLYKYAGSGSALGANYIRLAGATAQEYTVADAATVATVLSKLAIQTSADGVNADAATVAVTADMVQWNTAFDGAAAGTYAATVTCEGKTLGTVTVTVTGAHAFETVTVEPTCTEDGSVITTCTICGLQTVEVLKATGHEYTSVVTAPTCTEDGYTTYTCTCGDTYTADTVAALGHSYTAETTQPTCAKEGKTVYTCACGHSYTEVIPATGHEYTSVVTAPTCTKEGYTTYTCACGDTYTADVVAALGHSYTAVTTEPTCTEAGKTVYTCAACAHSYSETIAALGHSYSAVVTAPTCTEAGCTTYTCQCGDSYTETIPATGQHEYAAVVTKPTCTEAGYTTYTCACGDSYTETIPATGEHAYTAVVTKPTCTEAGYTTYTCQCGDSYTADSVAATGHGYTCAEVDGYLVYTCVGCGDSYSEKLPTQMVYTKVNRLSDNRFVITLVSGNRYYALSHSGNKLSAVSVTVSDDQITGEVTEDLVWEYEDNVLRYESNGTTYYLHAQSAGGWFAWLSTPTLTVSTSQSTTVSLSSNRLKLGSYYLRYSNGAISLSRSGTTAGLFAETVQVIAPLSLRSIDRG